jgi:uncharacterized protein (TIGR02453 family)
MNNLLSFLNDLKAHNTKEWMDANKPRYQKVRKEFHAWVDQLIPLMAEFDPSLTDVTAKDSTFRINRDIRFSKNKDPYKTNMGAAIQEGGKKTMNPTYYLHIEPGKSMLAGGLYMPPADVLGKVRQEIDYNPGELKKIIENKEFKEMFGAISGEALKTAPKGYPKDHPNIELLRFKSYVVMKDLSDNEVLDKSFMENVLHHFRLMMPFSIKLLSSTSLSDRSFITT